SCPNHSISSCTAAVVHLPADDLRRRFRVISAATIALLISRTFAADAPVAAAPPEGTTITVHASKDPKQLKKQIWSYVSSITKSSRTESLARWHVPVCPLVAGVSREKAEYFLERLSQVARDAH